MPTLRADRPKMPLGLRIIATLKLVKGIALLAVALGLFKLAHSDGMEELAHRTIAFLKISPENHYAQLLLEKAGLAQPRDVMKAGLLSGFYALILLTEGTALWIGASWAEYMVVLSTGAFVPEELLSCARRFTWTKLGVLLANAAILGYVIMIVWKTHKQKAANKAAAANAP